MDGFWTSLLAVYALVSSILGVKFIQFGKHADIFGCIGAILHWVVFTAYLTWAITIFCAWRKAKLAPQINGFTVLNYGAAAGAGGAARGGGEACGQTTFEAFAGTGNRLGAA